MLARRSRSRARPDRAAPQDQPGFCRRAGKEPIRRRADGRQSHDESSLMTLNIDLTDVAAHAVFNGELTGIQRVQIEYAGALLRLHEGRANVFSNVSGLVPQSLIRCSQRKDDLRSLRRHKAHVSASLDHSDSTAVEAEAREPQCPGRRAGFDAAPRTGRPPLRRRRLLGPSALDRRLRARRPRRLRRRGPVPRFHPAHLPGPRRRQGASGLRTHASPETRTIAISEHTRAQLDEARREVRAPPHLAPATVVRLAHEFSAVPRNYAPPEPPTLRTAMLARMGSFALCVGTVEVRKNHARILKLWESLAREAGAGWPKLVIAGKAGWHAGEALRTLRRADRDAPYLWIEAPTDRNSSGSTVGPPSLSFRVSRRAGDCRSARACGLESPASPQTPRPCRKSAELSVSTAIRTTSTLSPSRSFGLFATPSFTRMRSPRSRRAPCGPGRRRRARSPQPSTRRAASAPENARRATRELAAGRSRSRAGGITDRFFPARPA